MPEILLLRGLVFLRARIFQRRRRQQDLLLDTVWILRRIGRQERFGDVSAEVLVDNQKCEALEHGADGPRFDARLLDLAGHYGFTPRASKSARARMKGKDERKLTHGQHVRPSVAQLTATRSPMWPTTFRPSAIGPAITAIF